MTIIDAHHHIWRHAHTPWLNGPALPRIFGEYEPLRRDYLAQDFIDDVVPQGVVASVYIQVNVGPGDEVAEIEWVASVAREHGFPQASVGYADLSSPQVVATLDRLAQAHGERFAPPQLLRDMAAAGESFYGRAAVKKAA
jgi:predicted TIM-barrel fold metal-dependent hydrolase